MNEMTFKLVIAGLLFGSVIGGMWWADVKPVKDLIRRSFAWLRFAMVLAFMLGTSAALLYGLVRLVRFAWGS